MKKFISLGFIIVTPILLAFLLDFEIFNFAKGSTDSWITFWGSYVGALIGAAIVYLVTKIQVSEQRTIQLDTIRKEHDNALEREMKQYHFRNQLEKIHELYDILDDIVISSIKCSNEFTKYLVYNEALYNGNDKLSNEQEIEFKNKARKNYQNVYSWIHKFSLDALKVKRLSLYIEDADVFADNINELLNTFTSELKEGYKNKKSYEKYFAEGGNRVEIDSHMALITMIALFTSDVLDKKLNNKIKEMNKY